MVLEAIQPTAEVLGVANYISSTEAAKILKITARAVTELCKDGLIEGAEKLNEDVPNSPWIIPKEGFYKYKAERDKKKQG